MTEPVENQPAQDNGSPNLLLASTTFPTFPLHSNISAEDVQAALSFREKERKRRRQCHLRRVAKAKSLKSETVAKRCKKRKTELNSDESTKQKASSVFDILANEVNRIISYDIDNRLNEITNSFKWVYVLSEKRYVLQLKLPNDNKADLFYIAKSTIRGAGNGLFVCRDFPKNLPISIYLGRMLKEHPKGRDYVMAMPCKYVKKKDGDSRWEKT